MNRRLYLAEKGHIFLLQIYHQMEICIGSQHWKSVLEVSIGSQYWKSALESVLEVSIGNQHCRSQHWKSVLEVSIGSQHWKSALEVSIGSQHWKSALEVRIGSSHTSAWKLANDLSGHAHFHMYSYCNEPSRGVYMNQVGEYI